MHTGTASGLFAAGTIMPGLITSKISIGKLTRWQRTLFLFAILLVSTLQNLESKVFTPDPKSLTIIYACGFLINIITFWPWHPYSLSKLSLLGLQMKGNGHPWG